MQQAEHPAGIATAAAPVLAGLSSDDISLVAALNYAALTAMSANQPEVTRTIVDGTVECFGRLLPTLICRYAATVVTRQLDPIEAEVALTEVFLPEELALPLVRLIRLSLVVTQQAGLAGHEERLHHARAELHGIATEGGHDAAIRRRAAELLERASAPLGAAA